MIGTEREIMAEWKHKKDPVQGIHLDLKKRILWYDPKRYWVRWETTEILHIYCNVEREEKGEEPK